jgi:hydrophobic/amphiphilic exporter-1 (mainly G- bacteria), HAE1 family
LRWALVHKKSTVFLALGIFVASVFMVRLLGTEFVPKADFSETSLKFETPVGTSLEATEAKTRQVEAILRDFPEVRYTVSTINTANAQGKNNVNLYIRLVDRKNRNRNADQMSAVLRERLKQVPGIAVTTPVCSTRLAATSKWSSRCKARTKKSWSAWRCWRWPRCATFPAWWTWTPA